MVKQVVAQTKALLDIFVSGALNYHATSEQTAVSPIERILHWGHETGELRAFDVQVMATSIQRSIEGQTFLLTGNPKLDLNVYSSLWFDASRFRRNPL